MWAAFGTLADLAPGRIRLGAGGGVLEPEFDALGSPFRARGARLDETFALVQFQRLTLLNLLNWPLIWFRTGGEFTPAQMGTGIAEVFLRGTLRARH